MEAQRFINLRKRKFPRLSLLGIDAESPIDEQVNLTRTQSESDLHNLSRQLLSSPHAHQQLSLTSHSHSPKAALDCNALDLARAENQYTAQNTAAPPSYTDVFIERQKRKGQHFR